MFYAAFLMPNLPRRGLELELLDTNTKAQVSMWPGRREVGERRAWGRDAALWTNFLPCLGSRPQKASGRGQEVTARLSSRPRPPGVNVLTL